MVIELKTLRGILFVVQAENLGLQCCANMKLSTKPVTRASCLENIDFP